MAWPPPVFDFTYTNATSQLDDHPNIHNEVNDSLNTDFRPKIDDNASRLTVNDGLIAGNTTDLLNHETTSWQTFTATLNWADTQPENGPLGGGTLEYRVRHGVCHLAIATATIQSGFPGGAAGTSAPLTMILAGAPDISGAGDLVSGVGYFARTVSGGGSRSPYWFRRISNDTGTIENYEDPSFSSWDRFVNGDTFFLSLSYRTGAADTP